MPIHAKQPSGKQMFKAVSIVKETLNKSFDRLRTNGNLLIPFVLSLSNHGRNQLNQSFLNDQQYWPLAFMFRTPMIPFDTAGVFR